MCVYIYIYIILIIYSCELIIYIIGIYVMVLKSERLVQPGTRSPFFGFLNILVFKTMIYMIIFYKLYIRNYLYLK